MNIAQNINGIQHIGLPTASMADTQSFYEGLGFEIAFGINNKGSEVKFFKLGNLVIEAYEKSDAVQMPGAIDHIALDVKDIESAFDAAKQNGYEMLDEEIQFLPFWAKGVKFFTIMGPNKEKIEFSQML